MLKIYLFFLLYILVGTIMHKSDEFKIDGYIESIEQVFQLSEA